MAQGITLLKKFAVYGLGQKTLFQLQGQPALKWVK